MWRRFGDPMSEYVGNQTYGQAPTAGFTPRDARSRSQGSMGFNVAGGPFDANSGQPAGDANGYGGTTQDTPSPQPGGVNSPMPNPSTPGNPNANAQGGPNASQPAPQPETLAQVQARLDADARAKQASISQDPNNQLSNQLGYGGDWSSLPASQGGGGVQPANVYSSGGGQNFSGAQQDPQAVAAYLAAGKAASLSNAPPVGPPSGSVATYNPNVFQTQSGATWIKPGSVNNASDAEYQAYMRRTYGSYPKVGPSGPYPIAPGALGQQP
jgi:hypothetical protein